MDGGVLEEEKEEGDITKLHLKLGLSPLESPLRSLPLSLSLSLSGIPGRLRSSGTALQWK